MTVRKASISRSAPRGAVRSPFEPPHQSVFEGHLKGGNGFGGAHGSTGSPVALCDLLAGSPGIVPALPRVSAPPRLVPSLQLRYIPAAAWDNAMPGSLRVRGGVSLPSRRRLPKMLPRRAGCSACPPALFSPGRWSTIWVPGCLRVRVGNPSPTRRHFRPRR